MFHMDVTTLLETYPQNTNIFGLKVNKKQAKNSQGFCSGIFDLMWC